MSEGYLYCFSNISMLGILKIGMTNRTPDIRLSEANTSDTWRPPTPYKIEFAKKVSDPLGKERSLHSLLQQYTNRIHPRREFFHVSTEEVYNFFNLMGGKWWNETYTEDINKEDEINNEDEIIEEIKKEDEIISNSILLKKRSMPLECKFLVNECENMVECRFLAKRLKFSEWYKEFKKFSGNMRSVQKSSIVKSNFRLIDIAGIKHTCAKNIDYMTIENAETVLEDIAKRY